MLRMRMADDDTGPRPTCGVGLGNDAFKAETGCLERNGALSHGVHPRNATDVPSPY